MINVRQIIINDRFEIPPRLYGAVEKVIYYYDKILNLDKFSFSSKIAWLNEALDEIENVDIIHTHVANLAIEAKRILKNKKVIFSVHDHHSFIYDTVLIENLKAANLVDGVIFHSTQLMNFFIENGIEVDKCFYLEHGVDTEKFILKDFRNIKNEIFLYAANGLFDNKLIDRKGFLNSIKVAKALDLNITIAGPKVLNDDFVKFYDLENYYEKLKILYDLTEDELIENLRTCLFTTSFSTLEAGIPNLTILESLSTGTPVFGFLEQNENLYGYIFVNKFGDYIRDIKLIYENLLKNKSIYELYSISIRNNIIKEYDWKIVVEKLKKIYKEVLKK